MVHTECERGKEFGRKGEKEGERFSEMEGSGREREEWKMGELGRIDIRNQC